MYSLTQIPEEYSKSGSYSVIKAKKAKVFPFHASPAGRGCELQSWGKGTPEPEDQEWQFTGCLQRGLYLLVHGQERVEDGNWANPQAGRLVRKLPSHRQLGTKWPNGRGEAQVPAGRLGLGRGHDREVGTRLALQRLLSGQSQTLRALQPYYSLSTVFLRTGPETETWRQRFWLCTQSLLCV